MEITQEIEQAIVAVMNADPTFSSIIIDDVFLLAFRAGDENQDSSQRTVAVFVSSQIAPFTEDEVNTAIAWKADVEITVMRHSADEKNFDYMDSILGAIKAIFATSTATALIDAEMNANTCYSCAEYTAGEVALGGDRDGFKARKINISCIVGNVA